MPSGSPASACAPARSRRATCTPPSRARRPTAPGSPREANAAGRGRDPDRPRRRAQLVRAAALPVLVVDRPARCSARWRPRRSTAHPPRRCTLIGVTGTQGKTTTTQLLARRWRRPGRRTAVIGTMGTWVAGEPVQSALTTPEAPDLHALFAVMREQGVEVCAMEVSSHALVMGRVDGVRFDVAVFSNFGRDHLDFHHDVEELLRRQGELFTPERARRALLEHRRPGGRRSLRTRSRSPSDTARRRAHAGRLACDDVDASGRTARASGCVGPGGLRHRGHPRCRATSTSRTRWPPGRRGRGRRSTCRPPRRVWRRSRGARPAGADRRRAAVRGRRGLCAQAGCRRRRARAPYARSRGPADRSCSAPAATGTAASGR